MCSHVQRGPAGALFSDLCDRVRRWLQARDHPRRGVVWVYLVVRGPRRAESAAQGRGLGCSLRARGGHVFSCPPNN